MPKSGSGPYQKICDGCKNHFFARMINQRYCKPECARKKTFAVLRKCQCCGDDFLGFRVDKKVCGKPECLKSLSHTNSLTWRARMLGITEDQYWKMSESQHGLCSICKKPETQIHKGKLSNLSIDHDHVTGKIRGLLCSRCNHGLGHFKDDISSLKNAIEYLEKNS